MLFLLFKRKFNKVLRRYSYIGLKERQLKKKYHNKYELQKIKIHARVKKNYLPYSFESGSYALHYRRQFWRYIARRSEEIRRHHAIFYPQFSRYWALLLRYKRAQVNLLVNPNIPLHELNSTDWRFLFSGLVKHFIKLKKPKLTYSSQNKKRRLLKVLGKLRARQYDPRFTIGTKIAKTKQWTQPVSALRYWTTEWGAVWFRKLQPRYYWVSWYVNAVWGGKSDQHFHYKVRFRNETLGGRLTARVQKARWLDFINRYNHNITRRREFSFTTAQNDERKELVPVSHKIAPTTKPAQYRRRNLLFRRKIFFWRTLSWYIFKALSKRRSFWFRLISTKKRRFPISWWLEWSRSVHKKVAILGAKLPRYHTRYFRRIIYRRLSFVRRPYMYWGRLYKLNRRDRWKIIWRRKKAHLIYGSRLAARTAYDAYRRRIWYRLPTLLQKGRLKKAIQFLVLKALVFRGKIKYKLPEPKLEHISPALATTSRRKPRFLLPVPRRKPKPRWKSARRIVTILIKKKLPDQKARIHSRSGNKAFPIYRNQTFARQFSRLSRFKYRRKWKLFRSSRRWRKWFLLPIYQYLRIKDQTSSHLARAYQKPRLKYIYRRFLNPTYAPILWLNREEGLKVNCNIYNTHHVINKGIQAIFNALDSHFWNLKLGDSAQVASVNMWWGHRALLTSSDECSFSILAQHTLRMFLPHYRSLIGNIRLERKWNRIFIWNKVINFAADADFTWRFEAKKWPFQYARWKRAFKLSYFLFKASRNYRKLKKDAMFFKLFKMYFWYVTRIDELKLIRIWRKARNALSARFGTPGIQGFMTMFQLRLTNFFMFVGLAFDIQAAETLASAGMVRINSFIKTSPHTYFHIGDIIQISLLQRNRFIKIFSRIYWIKIETQSRFISFFSVAWELLLFLVLRWPRPYEQLKAGSWLNTRWLRFYIRQIPVRLYRFKKKKKLFNAYN